MDFEQSPPIENNESESTAEEVPEIPAKNVITEEELTALQKKSEAQDVAELSAIRQEMGLPDPTEKNVSEITKAKSENKENLTPLQKLEKALESKDARSVDHASREVFRQAIKEGDLALARKMVDLASDASGRQGRINRFEELTGKVFGLSAEQQPTTNQESGDENIVEQQEKISNTASFKKAIEAGDLDSAENWLLEVKDTTYAGNTTWLNDCSLELFRARRNNGNYAAAKRMVELASSPDGIQGRKDVLAKEAGIPYEQI